MKHPNRMTKREEGWSRPGISWRKQKDICDSETKPIYLPNTKRKKMGKDSKKWRCGASICPFCDATLPELPKKKDIPIWKTWGKKYSHSCVCGASEHDDCPCCHRKTWAKNDWKGTLIYKHKDDMWGGCGFSGERRKENQMEEVAKETPEETRDELVIKIESNLRTNAGDYNSMVSIAGLYKKLYGKFPKIGMSGQQAEFAQCLCDHLPEPSKENQK